MDSNADISKIIGMIMENPDIIEKIKNLTQKSSENENEYKEDSAIEKNEYKEKQNLDSLQKEEKTIDYIKEVSKEHIDKKGIDKKRRNELLCALKPYISKKRSDAIDTMLSLFDIFEIMKER